MSNDSPKILSTEEIYKDNVVLAFIIDGEVVENLMCHPRMAAVLQSNPTVVELTNEDPFINGPHVGWRYDGEKFLRPNVDF